MVEKIQYRIDRYSKINEMIEQSTVSSDEALYATKHPQRYSTRILMENGIIEGSRAGIEGAAIAGTISFAASTVDNAIKVIDGEITAREAFVDIGKDTGTSMGVAYGTTFISQSVAVALSASSHELIRSFGRCGIPEAVIAFGVESYDSITDYAEGVIGGEELAYDLGESFAQVSGSTAGSIAASAAVCSLVPGVGTATGIAVGLVGGMVGCAVATEAYKTAIEIGVENAGVLADKAQEMANHTVEMAKMHIPDKVVKISSVINQYAIDNELLFRV